MRHYDNHNAALYYQSGGVSLEPEDPPAEATVYPPSRGFSCLGYGDYSHRNAVYN